MIRYTHDSFDIKVRIVLKNFGIDDIIKNKNGYDKRVDQWLKQFATMNM
jgi:hypothetical protein